MCWAKSRQESLVELLTRSAGEALAQIDRHVWTVIMGEAISDQPMLLLERRGRTVQPRARTRESSGVIDALAGPECDTGTEKP